MTVSPLHIGALACSSIAYRQILPVVASDEGFKLCSVASRSTAKAVDFAGQFDTHPCSYEELLADPAVEAVYVSVPVGLHAEWGQAVLESGKHLLLEKTFTADLASAERLVEAGRRRGLVVMEALAYVFHPMLDEVFRLVENGDLGRLRHIEAHFCIPERPEGDIRLEPALGGGALLDMLVYPLSFCLNYFKMPPLRLDPVSMRDEGARVDSRGCVQLEWPQTSAHLTYGFGMMYRNEIFIGGEGGGILANRVFTRPSEMTEGVACIRDNQREEVLVPGANAYARMLRHFHLRIRGKVPPGINEGENLLARMKLISELREALATNE
jgi:dTDP-3,4-didehydro-2,6-dideoxy-alpha-D-glucose 3-reductase